MGAPLGSEDRAWVPRGKVLEMADFGGVAHTWQPCRMNRLGVNIFYGEVLYGGVPILEFSRI